MEVIHIELIYIELLYIERDLRKRPWHEHVKDQRVKRDLYICLKNSVHTHFVSNFAETVVCKRQGRKEVDIRYWIQAGVLQCVLQCALQYVAACCSQGDIGYQNHGGVL